MQRRTFLGTLAGGLTVGFAGCSVLSGPDPATVGAISEDDELPPPTLGTGDVGVAVFSDYRCGYCANFERNVRSEVLNQYSEEITYVHRDFPLQMHSPWAQKTASATRAIQDSVNDDGFWTATERAFDETYFPVGSLSGIESVAAPFEQQTIDAARMAAENREYEDRVQADKELGRQIGVDGTPTVFVNGSEVSLELNAQEEYIPDPVLDAIEDAL